MVYLVGAGPGDPDLLTRKAFRLIASADVILHDALVPASILALAGKKTEIVNVGKRCGAKSTTQAEIDARMVASARRGLRVVRLHGGDPTIFGRLAEETDSLETAGIAFEVVPGITAATAAAAQMGISLTDRRKSSRVVIVSGHRARTNAPQEHIDWKQLACEEATLIIYMPGNHFSGLCDELLAVGFARETPAAMVSRATTSHEQFRFTTLGELGTLPHMESPAVLLIGRTLDRARKRFNRQNAARALGEAELILSSF
jgi:uroporphyrin-III C-methyltransferase